MGGNNKNKRGAPKRRLSEGQSDNGNATKLIEAKKGKISMEKPLARNVKNNNKAKGTNKTVNSLQKRGKLNPRKLDMSAGATEFVPNAQTDVNADENSSVQQGHCSQGRSNQIVTQADVYREPSQNENQQQTDDGNDSMQNDGIEVGVPDSEDDFGQSDLEYEDENDTNTGDSNIDNQEDNDESDDPEITLSTKKRFLRKELERDPQLKEVFDKLVDERVEERCESRSRSPRKKHRSKNDNVMSKEKASVISKSRRKSMSVTKSPSDSTIYTLHLKEGDKANSIIDRISNFVESMRMGSARNDDYTPRRESRSPSVQSTPRSSKSKTDEPQPGSSSEIHGADKLIIDAERFKVNIIAPQGMLPIKIDEKIELLRNLDNDDDFFHVTCHIDEGLKSKIQRGEYVDLERLLPKDRTFGSHSLDDGTAVQLFIKNSQAYFTPPDNEKKITGIRHWDQAFRVYATIYTQANPERSSEIWQYVHVIHTAASTYNWNNMAFYDFTFWQLMASKPWRSWAKTYNQGWNLALKDPTIKAFNTGHGNSFNNGTTAHRNGNRQKDWCDNCCCRFNKNRCKEGNSCNWDHCCSYCGGWNSHGSYNCKKRLNKKGGSRGESSEKDKGGRLPPK